MTEQPQTPDESAAPTASNPDDTITDLEGQLEAMKREAADNYDRFLRARADLDNFRKRNERLSIDLNRQIRKDLLGKILAVMDNLERALAFQETADPEALRQGLRLTQWQLAQLLEQEGLKPVPTVGESFNPYLHDAIDSVASEEHPEGDVVDEVRKGYTFGDDVLRPAQVRVSAGPTKS